MSTIIQQGRFTSTGGATTLKLRSDVDWFRCWNLTIADAAQTTAVGVEYYWQRGFAADRGLEYKKSNAANAANLTDYVATGGFTLVTNTNQAPTAAVAIAGASNATSPSITTASTAGLSNGDIVELSSVTGAPNIAGFEFQIDTLVANTSFDMMAVLANAPGAAGTAGFWRKVPYNPIFYPRRRYITNVTQAAQPTVTTSVDYEFSVGDYVSFRVASEFGMSELNNMVGRVVSIPTPNTFTVDIDTTGFTAFVWPAAAAVPFTYPQVIPFGVDTAASITAGGSSLALAVRNDAYIGLQLAAGADSPAGALNDVIYWQAGKSFLVDNDGLLVVT